MFGFRLKFNQLKNSNMLTVLVLKLKNGWTDDVLHLCYVFDDIPETILLHRKINTWVETARQQLSNGINVMFRGEIISHSENQVGPKYVFKKKTSLAKFTICFHSLLFMH